jgi:ankyrin repeat protein
MLFECINDSCTEDDEGRDTPLTYAASYGHVEVVRLLLEGGANVDSADGYQRTALYLAASYGLLDVCRLLLEWGAKVNHLNKWENTPLHTAAGEGHLSVVKLLVEWEADVSVRNVLGLTARDIAWIFLHNDVADWLDSVRRG